MCAPRSSKVGHLEITYAGGESPDSFTCLRGDLVDLSYAKSKSATSSKAPFTAYERAMALILAVVIQVQGPLKLREGFSLQVSVKD